MPIVDSTSGTFVDVVLTDLKSYFLHYNNLFFNDYHSVLPSTIKQALM